MSTPETLCSGCAAGCNECDPVVGFGGVDDCAKEKLFTVVFVDEDEFYEDFTTRAISADEAVAECMLAKSDFYRLIKVVEGA